MKKYLTYKFKQANKKYGSFGIILLIISIISIAIGIYITFVFISKIATTVSVIESGESIDQQLTGVIGDFIGGIVGTIWSFAGVILFFLALRLQSKELSLQLEELKDTRLVFKTQQFENTFFNLLKNQNDIRLNTEIKNKDYNYQTHSNQDYYIRGNAVFEEIKDILFKEKENLDSNLTKSETVKTILESDIEIKDEYWDKEKGEKFLKKFKNHYSVSYDLVKNNPSIYPKLIFKLVYNRFNNQLSHYFRNIYHILLYIKENEEREISTTLFNEINGNKIGIYINKENVAVKNIRDKYKKYSQFLQAQMSNTELLLLFYNVLFFPKAKKLVQYYDLIENLNVDDLLFPDTDIQYYDEFTDNLEIIPKSSLKSRDEIMKI